MGLAGTRTWAMRLVRNLRSDRDEVEDGRSGGAYGGRRDTRRDRPGPGKGGARWILRFVVRDASGVRPIQNSRLPS